MVIFGKLAKLLLCFVPPRPAPTLNYYLFILLMLRIVVCTCAVHWSAHEARYEARILSKWCYERASFTSYPSPAAAKFETAPPLAAKRPPYMQ